MNFEECITAHSNVKLKLRRYLSNTDGSISAADLSKDDLCELGKWIKGEGKKYAAEPAYKELVLEHAQFHKCAGDIVSKCDKGDKAKAEEALNATSEFSKHSLNVVIKIQAIKKLQAH
ncbi:MAG TPA: CZB domain-containing protein [Alphaproteobacteria bacterium]|nr:CZB domain-containing protein [Alphaproteobacteria bacterium]